MEFIYCLICGNITINIGVLCTKCNRHICDFCLYMHNCNYIKDNKMPDCRICFLD